jgi:predicted RNase H-like HicB family nuclease
VIAMETKKFVYFQDGNMFIGWLEEFPDYKTQGETLDELKGNLKDIYEELTGGGTPKVIHVGEVRPSHVAAGGIPEAHGMKDIL